MAMRYDEQIVVRCSAKLRKRIDTWAKQHDLKPGELTRKVLEKAFGIEEEVLLPPGVARVEPTQGAPVKA